MKCCKLNDLLWVLTNANIFLIYSKVNSFSLNEQEGNHTGHFFSKAETAKSFSKVNYFWTIESNALGIE